MRDLPSEIPTQSDPDELLREPGAAEVLDVTPRTMEAWRHRGGGPPYIRLSARAIRYRRGDLLEWALQRRVRSTAEYGA